MEPLSKQKVILILLLIAPFLIIQALWIFRDAKRRGEKYYWLWGLFGLMNTPQSLLVYLVVTRIIIDRKFARK